MEDDSAAVVGTKTVVDYKGVSMSHVAQASPALMKKMVYVCQVNSHYILKNISIFIKRNVCMPITDH